MTAPNGPILLNSSTGSDTAASGLGPATALSGAGASTTAASAVVTGITTTGVTTGDLLWLQSSSGRQFSVIASVDSGSQVTCDDVFANTEALRTWAIGGKRATFDGAVQIFSDWHGGWIVETETDQTVSVWLTASVTSGTVNNYVEIRCNNKTITQSYASYWAPILPLPNYSILRDAVLTTSVTNNGMSLFPDNSGPDRLVQNVHIDPTLGGGSLTYGVYTGQTAFFMGCSFKNCTYGFTGAATGSCQFSNCVFDSNLSYGANPSSACGFTNCIFSNNGNHGLLCGNGNYNLLVDCISYGNSGDGFNMGGAYVDTLVQFKNNIASSNTGYGYNFPTARGNPMLNSVDYNNTAGRVAGYYTDIDPITLTADPFTDTANGDFSLNSNAGGGAVLRAESDTIGSTTAYPFNWLTDGSGGGGGGATHYDPFTNPRF